MLGAVVMADEVRPCLWCGRDALHFYDGDFVRQVELDARDGHDVDNGWRLIAGHWYVHLASVAPHGVTAHPAHKCRDIATEKREQVVTDEYVDPFDAPDKRPSVTFKDAAVGTTYACRVDAAPKLVQSRDFNSGEPATWPDGNPKMTAVIDVTVDGEERSVWAAKPSALFAAIATAQRAAGSQIAPGGTLTLRLTGEKPSDNPRKNAQKLYEARYAPPLPDAFATAGASEAPPWES